MEPVSTGSPRVGAFLLGAPHCGAEILGRALAQHPEVHLAPAPGGPTFFEAGCPGGPEGYLAGDFAARGRARLLVDGRDWNLLLPWVPALLHAYNPRARLVVTMRHPIERALSHWAGDRAAGLSALSFPMAIAEELGLARRGERPEPETLAHRHRVQGDPNRRRPWPALLRGGDYAVHLAGYLEHFPRSQLHLVLHRDLLEDPAHQVARLLDFLDLDPARLGAGRDLAPPEPRPGSGVAARLWGLLESLAGAAGARGLLATRRHRWLLDSRTRSFLGEYFRPRVRALEDLLGVPSAWEL